MGKYFINGLTYDVDYINDIPQGKGIVKGKNGLVLCEGVFLDGKLNGEHLTYNEKGDLRKLETYKNGVLDGKFIIYYHHNSVVKYEGYNNSGVLDGVFRSYYPNGNIQSYVEYSFGEKNGVTRNYFMGLPRRISVQNIYDVGVLKSTFIYDIKGYLVECIFINETKKHIIHFNDSVPFEEYYEYNINGLYLLVIDGLSDTILLEDLVRETTIDLNKENIIDDLIDLDIEGGTFKKLLECLNDNGIKQ